MSKVNSPSTSSLFRLVEKYTGLRDLNEDAWLYRDLGLDGGDYVEFISEVEHIYSVNLEKISPHDGTRSAKDVSIAQLKEIILRQIGRMDPAGSR